MNMSKFFFVLLLLLIFTCSANDELSQTCNPADFFTKDDPADFDRISTKIFDPYCSSCHSSATWRTGNAREGYLPLDHNMKNYSTDFSLRNLLESYVNFANPEESKLYRVLNEASVSRTLGGDIVTQREPRNSCYLPADYKDAILRWIKNSKDISGLFN